MAEDTSTTETAPEDQDAPEELDAAAKRSEAAKKGAATKADNARKDAATEELYKHLRHTIGAEVSIDQARQIVEMVLTSTAAE